MGSEQVRQGERLRRAAQKIQRDYGIGYCERLVADAYLALLADITAVERERDELRAILKDIPDPEREGYCEECNKRLSLTTVYRRSNSTGVMYRADFFKHETCYYAAIQRLRGDFDTARDEPSEQLAGKGEG